MMLSWSQVSVIIMMPGVRAETVSRRSSILGKIERALLRNTDGNDLGLSKSDDENPPAQISSALDRHG